MLTTHVTLGDTWKYYSHISLTVNYKTSQKAASVILTALNDGEIEFRKSYEATVKLGSNKPDELIKGLSGCLEEILTKLESDLRKTYGQR